MLFLVEMHSNLGGLPAAQVEAIRAAEMALAMEYLHRGLIRRIFRTVGRDGNHSLWEADSLEALHDALRVLPKFPWANITVTPLVQHPAEAAYLARHGALPSF